MREVHRRSHSTPQQEYERFGVYTVGYERSKERFQYQQKQTPGAHKYSPLTTLRS